MQYLQASNQTSTSFKRTPTSPIVGITRWFHYSDMLLSSSLGETGRRAHLLPLKSMWISLIFFSLHIWMSSGPQGEV
jgi:hypothetical protein